jgi:transcriptional regulator with XRE-family HTH domain
MLKLSVERQRRGWSKTKLGIRAEINPVSIGLIEMGRTPVWPAWRKRLSYALNIPESELFDQNGHPIEEVLSDGNQTA